MTEPEPRFSDQDREELRETLLDTIPAIGGPD